MSLKRNFSASYEDHPEKAALVCNISGRLLGTPACYDFLSEARDRCESGACNLILDMDGLDRINSTGVGILAALYTSANRRGGRVIVTGLADHLREILEVMRLFEFLHEEETVEAALGSVARQE